MADLTTLADVKTLLGISAATDDAAISKLITGVSDYMHLRLGTDFEAAEVTEKQSGVGSDAIVSDRPIKTIVTITEKIGGLVDAADYELGISTRVIYRNSGRWETGRRNVTIVYDPIDAIPPRVSEAATILSGYMWKQWGAETGGGRLGLNAQANSDTGSADYFAQSLRQLPFVAEVLSQARWDA